MGVMSEMTVKCPICGKPYKIYPYFFGDQSVCPDCQSQVEKPYYQY